MGETVDYAAIADRVRKKADYAAIAERIRQGGGDKPQGPQEPTDVGSQLQAMQRGKRNVDVVDAAVESLPYVGAAAGGLAAGTLGLPLGPGALAAGAVGAAAGGAGGEGYRQAIQTWRGKEAPRSGDQIFTDIVKTGAGQGALEGAGLAAKWGLRTVGPGLKAGAVSAYERMLKPNKTTLEGMNRFGGNLQSRSKTIAQELIADPHGQISKTGANRFDDATSAIRDQVDAVVDANPEARGSTQHLVDALANRRERFAEQWANKQATGSFDEVAKQALTNPRIMKSHRAVVPDFMGTKTSSQVVGQEMIPRVRAQTARNLTRGTYRNLGDAKYGDIMGAGVEAHKATAHGGRAILNEALPQVEPLNNAIARRLDLGQVLDEAVFRSGKHDLLSLGQKVVLSGHAPGWLPATLIARPGIGSPIARGVYQAGTKMAGAENRANAIRALLLAQMATRDRSEE